jgi:DNA-binding SARP family transcriptional activator
VVNDGLRWELLGPVRAWRGDIEVNLGPPQQRAILMVLLLREGGVASTERLISAVWGTAPPPAAAGMVRSYISRLRRALDDGTKAPVIESVAGGYAVRDPDRLGARREQLDVLDLTVFERRIRAGRDAGRSGDVQKEAAELRAALSLWKGTPLGGVGGDVADNERTRLVELRCAVVEDLAAADLRLGRHPEAESALVQLVAEHPLRERARELLMLTFYRAGRKADALELFHQTRRVLADELGLDPGPELQEMQRRILASEPSLAGPRGELQVGPQPGASAGADPIESPMQLPPDLPLFVGRSDELRWLDRVMRASGTQVPVIGLTGAPGVGKSALAIHAGHRWAGKFSAGRYFVDLSSPDDPLSALLRAIGVTEPPLPAGERAALWRSLTTGRRLLVILDNVYDAEQVRPLLPGPGGPCVLLTARRQLFGLPHATWTKVDPFSEGDTLAMLRRLVGERRIQAEPADARRLYDLTSGLPQVVHAAGTRLASRPGWSLATAVQKLTAHGQDPDWRFEECRTIYKAFQSAMTDLSTSQATAFHLLAVLDAPSLSLSAAAAVLDLPPNQTESLLEDLADRHLLETPGDRYSYLNPLREFARSRAPIEVGAAACEAALLRFAQHPCPHETLPSAMTLTPT